MKLRAILVAGALAVVGAACGDDGGGDGGNGEISAPGGPRDGDDVLVQVATRGGYVPVEVHLAAIPQVTIYGDGRMVVVGPTTEQFPPNALPNLQEGRLDADQLDDVLAAAADAGLLDGEPSEYGEPDITDLPTTTVTVSADGDEHSVSVYGFGIDDDSGLSDEEEEAREQLQDFVADLPTDAADREYEPEAIAVFAQPYDGLELDDGGGTEAEQVKWPLGDLADGEAVDAFGADAGCVLVEGDDVDAVLDAADGVGTTARWESEGDEYELVFRPLLPDETGCLYTDDEPTGGADGLLVQVDLGGNGWVGNPVTELPEVSVYADGRIVVSETDSSDPMPEVLEYVVSDAGIDLVIEAADDAGLLDDEAPDYGDTDVTDQGTTVVLLDIDGTTRAIDVYALEFEEAGLTDDQENARADLIDFIDQLSDPDFYDDTLVEERDYETTALAVVYRPFDPERDDAGYEPVAWPLGADLADAGEPFERAGTTSRCLVVEGDDVATVLDAAADTYEETPWASGGADYKVTFRPLLPDESTCTDVADRPTATGGGA